MENNINIGQNRHFPPPPQQPPQQNHFFNPPPINNLVPSKPLPTKKRVTNLFEADLARLFKSKALLIIGIIFAALTFLSIVPLVLVRIFGGISYYELSGFTELSLMPALTSTFMAAIVLFIAINTGSEYSYNTIRNKVIAGNSRIKIYFSTLLFNMFVMLAIYLAVILILLPFTGLVFSFYGTLNRLARLAMGIPVYLSIVALTTFISMSIKSRAVGIMVNIALVFLIPTLILGAVFIAFIGFAFNPDLNFELFIRIITLNPYSMITEVLTPLLDLPNLLGSLFSGDLDAILDPSIPWIRALGVSIGYGGAATGLGILRFSRMDIK